MISAKKALVLVRSIMLEAFGSNRRVGGDSAEELWVMLAGFKSRHYKAGGSCQILLPLVGVYNVLGGIYSNTFMNTIRWRKNYGLFCKLRSTVHDLNF